MITLTLAAAALAVRVSVFLVPKCLVFAHGGFWLCRERDDVQSPSPAAWPSVTIVVPARNEAAGIAASISSLLGQDYPALSIVLVDDDSDDDTAAVAREAAAALGTADRLTIVTGHSLPAGWTGKLRNICC